MLRTRSGLTEMDAETAGLMAFGAAVLAFLWNLRRDIEGLRMDISDLRYRASRMEGMLEGMLRGVGLKASPDSTSGQFLDGGLPPQHFSPNP